MNQNKRICKYKLLKMGRLSKIDNSHQTQPITRQKSTLEKNLDGPGKRGKRTPSRTGSKGTTREPATTEEEK
jgi:hypothetical protein